MEYVLKTINLTKSFSNNIVVNSINMKIERGNIYGLIGENGAGKTTFMKIISGLIKPSSGEIELFESKELENQRFRTGCIIEKPALYLNMSARDNLELYRKAIGISSKNCVNELLKVDELLKLVGLHNIKTNKVKNFSMGMKQRLGIALALMGNPDFLILDEPINGLDPIGIKEIRDLILDLNKINNITILISSHILSELSKIATHYGVIKDGILINEFSSDKLEIKSQRCLKIKVDNILKASSIIETQLKIFDYDILDADVIRIFGNIEIAGTINTELIKNGIVVKSLIPIEQDLESYFMNLMEDSENVKSNQC